jgi:3-hydroxymyristoyl/3-hydroxydecanoyl-(acyl carrier protein) dehydratase
MRPSAQNQSRALHLKMKEIFSFSSARNQLYLCDYIRAISNIKWKVLSLDQSSSDARNKIILSEENLLPNDDFSSCHFQETPFH